METVRTTTSSTRRASRVEYCAAGDSFFHRTPSSCALLECARRSTQVPPQHHRHLLKEFLSCVPVSLAPFATSPPGAAAASTSSRRSPACPMTSVARATRPTTRRDSDVSSHHLFEVRSSHLGRLRPARRAGTGGRAQVQALQLRRDRYGFQGQEGPHPGLAESHLRRLIERNHLVVTGSTSNPRRRRSPCSSLSRRTRVLVRTP